MQQYDDKENLPLIRHWRYQLQGTGAAVPTVVIGHGATLTRPAIGRILFSFAENPGTFVGLGNQDFRDNAAQATVKGCSATAGVMVVTNGVFTLEVDIWSSAFAAFDMAATSFLDLDLVFSELAKP